MTCYRALTFSLLLQLTVTIPVSAATILFTDRTTWTTAVAVAGGNVSNLDFEGIAPTGGTAPLPMLGGLTFRGPGGLAPAVFDSAFASFISIWGTGDMLVAPLGLGTSVAPPGGIDLPAGVNALGLSYAVTCQVTVTPTCGSLPWLASLIHSGSTETFSIPGTKLPPEMPFIGFISDLPIATFQLDSSASLMLIDNLSFGTASAQVPEPNLLLLVGTGLMFVRRRL
jgi:hypothetical protein